MSKKIHLVSLSRFFLRRWKLSHLTTFSETKKHSKLEKQEDRCIHGRQHP